MDSKLPKAISDMIVTELQLISKYRLDTDDTTLIYTILRNIVHSDSITFSENYDNLRDTVSSIIHSDFYKPYYSNDFISFFTQLNNPIPILDTFIEQTVPLIISDDYYISRHELYKKYTYFEKFPTPGMFSELLYSLTRYMMNLTHSSETRATDYKHDVTLLAEWGESVMVLQHNRCPFNGQHFGMEGCKSSSNNEKAIYIIQSFFELFISCLQKLVNPNVLVTNYFDQTSILFQHVFYLISMHFITIPVHLYKMYFQQINEIVKNDAFMNVSCTDETSYTCGRANISLSCADKNSRHVLYDTISSENSNANTYNIQRFL